MGGGEDGRAEGPSQLRDCGQVSSGPEHLPVHHRTASKAARDRNRERAAGLRLIFPKKQGRLTSSLVPGEGRSWASAAIMQADGLMKRQKKKKIHE